MMGKKLTFMSGVITAAFFFAALPAANAFQFSLSGKDSNSADKPAAEAVNTQQDDNLLDQPPAGYTMEDFSGMKVGNSSQAFSLDDLPQVVIVNKDIIKRDNSARQPRLGHLQITNIQVGKDKKTIQFTVHNSFDRKNAKPVRIGGILVTGQVLYDLDGGKKAHNTVLFKEKRLVLQKGNNYFTTDPKDYPHVTSIEKIQFFFLPAKTGSAIHEDTSTYADTSEPISVDAPPQMVVVDQPTIEQNAEKGDPRLGFLRIKDIKCDQANKLVNFSVENMFDRQDSEPIHVGSMVVTGMARFGYDSGKELHSCILYEGKHVVLAKGTNNFQSNPDLYPGVTKIESIEFMFTP